MTVVRLGDIQMSTVLAFCYCQTDFVHLIIAHIDMVQMHYSNWSGMFCGTL